MIIRDDGFSIDSSAPKRNFLAAFVIFILISIAAWIIFTYNRDVDKYESIREKIRKSTD